MSLSPLVKQRCKDNEKFHFPNSSSLLTSTKGTINITYYTFALNCTLINLNVTILIICLWWIQYYLRTIFQKMMALFLQNIMQFLNLFFLFFTWFSPEFKFFSPDDFILIKIRKRGIVCLSYKQYHIFNVYSTENDGSTSFYKIECSF